MHQHDYLNTLNELCENNADNLVALGQWVRNDALPWLWTTMSGIIVPAKEQHPNAKTPPKQTRLKPMVAKEAVRNGLRASVADRAKKKKMPSFYHAQLTMLAGEATLYCDAIDAFALAKSEGTAIFAEDARVDSLYRALHDMMGQAYILLEDASREIASNPGRFPSGRREHEHSFEVFLGTRQLIYGTYSGLAFADRAPYTPVAALRTAIELRMRDAFCISSYKNPAKPDQIIPIDLSRLFEAIQSKGAEMDFAIDLHDIWKVYRWSNFYLHAGVRDYPWVAGFVHRYLHPLFAGSPNINSGIRMKRETWHSVREALLPPGDELRLSQRLASAWKALWPKRKPKLHIPPVDERNAQCTFLD